MKGGIYVSYIEKSNIIYNLEAKNKYEAIKALAKKLDDNGYLNDFDVFLEDVIERENQITTGVGNGIAIPHGKSKAIKKSTIAMATLINPINWESLDGEETKYVFLLAIKDGDGTEHLRVLANLSAKLMDDAYISSIKESKSLDQLYEAINI